MFPHSHWLWKWEGLNFMTSSNKQGLEPGVLKVSRLGWNSAWRVLHCPQEKAGKQPGGRQHRNSIWRVPGAHWRVWLFSVWILETQPSGRETPFQEQSSWLRPFPYSTPQHKHRATWGKQHRLPNLLIPSSTPLCSGGTAPAPLSHAYLRPSTVGPSHRRPAKTTAHTMSPDQSPAGPQFWWRGYQGSFYKQTRVDPAKTCHIQTWDQTLPTKVRRASADAWPER